LTQKKSQKKTKIDPKRYSEILKQVHLNEIYLDSCSVSQKRQNLIQQKSIEFKIRDKVSYQQDDQRLKVTHNYVLTAKPPDLEKDFALKISVTFCLGYLSKKVIEEDFFDVYKEESLPINSWPYFREFVQSMTQRLSFPPLTLPLLKRA
jgi:preprotein translocase subunit SecB